MVIERFSPYEDRPAPTKAVMSDESPAPALMPDARGQSMMDDGVRRAPRNKGVGADEGEGMRRLPVVMVN
eukprot:scaffold328665_cov59-Tisochrysis_lutea.AAC.2